MVNRPVGTNPFEFIVLSSLRAAQLMRGCTPRVEAATKKTTTAQMEVAAGLVSRCEKDPQAVLEAPDAIVAPVAEV